MAGNLANAAVFMLGMDAVKDENKERDVTVCKRRGAGLYLEKTRL